MHDRHEIVSDFFIFELAICPLPSKSRIATQFEILKKKWIYVINLQIISRNAQIYDKIFVL
jgi:hypothetical protein